ncbi:MAG: DUF4258 domain-containing protein [Terrimonas sp.]|nr:DUF4258 domain-containing protein [Terrimonas sp.]
MNKKFLPYIILILLFLLLLAVRRCQGDKGPVTDNKKRTTQTTDPSSTVNRNRGFDRRISYIEYSNHARCRMKCRHITQAEVQAIMQEGKINYKKSDIQNPRCPRYALEGRTTDEQRVRVIFAQCDKSTTVVTVIDLDTDYKCDCPGDPE